MGKRIGRFEQLEFAEFACGCVGASGPGDSRPGARGGQEGASAGLRGGMADGRRTDGMAAAGGAPCPGAEDVERKKGRYLAVVYLEEDDGHGNLTLRKVTTSRYVTVGQIAAALGVSDQAIYQRVQEGEFDCGPLPVDRVGSAIRIPAETFLRWKETRVTGAEYERPHGRPFGMTGDE